MCSLFCALLPLSCKTTMTTVVITPVGEKSTVKSSIKVSQVREVLPADFPSELTQLLESHQLANFITKGCQWFLWQMIPYPESCCLLLLTNVLATRSCLGSFQLPDVRVSANPWRSAGFLSSLCRCRLSSCRLKLCVTWEWTWGVGVFVSGCGIITAAVWLMSSQPLHRWRKRSTLEHERLFYLIFRVDTYGYSHHWSDLMKTDVWTNRESGLFFSSIPSLL